MKCLLLVSLLSFSLTPDVVSQRPDFSGKWRLDPSRSESAMQGEAIGVVTVAIEQTDSGIRVETTSSKGTTSVEQFRFGAADPTVTDGRAVARWQDDTLITNAVREIRGQTVTVQHVRRLSGNEMIVESVVTVQHGYTLSGAKNYGVGRDVFVRIE